MSMTMLGNDNRLKKIALIALMGSVAILASTSFLNIATISPFDISLLDQQRQNLRQLSLALPDGGCKATPAILPDPPLPHPVAFVASYPGSGARMTWNLIEALTGLVTGDDWNSNGHGKNVVTVKTHYPQKNGQLVPFADEIPRVVLVVRNIKDAMPSLHNFRYEFVHRLENHSTRAPKDAWLQWRNENFEEELRSWVEHLRYWVDKYPSSNRLMLSYEDMINDTKGPVAAMKLSNFLAQDGAVEPIAKESVPCVWGVVVQRKGNKAGIMKLEGADKYVGSDPNEPQSFRQGGDSNKPYNKLQIDSMYTVVKGLKKEYEEKGDEFELVRILEEYLDSINELEYYH